MLDYSSFLREQLILVIEKQIHNVHLDRNTFLPSAFDRSKGGKGGWLPMLPIKLTLIPVCSSFFPSFGRTMTVPLTDSPSLYNGAFSFLSFPPVLNSTMSRASSPSRRISISHTGLKKLAIVE
jgi:hypothetical protein